MEGPETIDSASWRSFTVSTRQPEGAITSRCQTSPPSTAFFEVRLLGIGSLPACHYSFANMSTIDYRAMAEEWVDHVVRQYKKARLRTKDLALIEHLLKVGFTLVATRDSANVLHIDFLGKRNWKPEKLATVS